MSLIYTSEMATTAVQQLKHAQQIAKNWATEHDLQKKANKYIDTSAQRVTELNGKMTTAVDEWVVQPHANMKATVNATVTNASTKVKDASTKVTATCESVKTRVADAQGTARVKLSEAKNTVSSAYADASTKVNSQYENAKSRVTQTSDAACEKFSETKEHLVSTSAQLKKRMDPAVVRAVAVEYRESAAQALSAKRQTVETVAREYALRLRACAMFATAWMLVNASKVMVWLFVAGQTKAAQGAEAVTGTWNTHSSKVQEKVPAAVVSFAGNAASVVTKTWVQTGKMVTAKVGPVLAPAAIRYESLMVWAEDNLE